VWRGRRRLRQLESEIAAAKADRAELRRRLEFFEMIAAAAGVASDTPAAESPVPLALMAAAREVHPQDVPVRLDVGGSEVIAVVGGEGDPSKWWTAICQLACPAEETA
jgi:sugar/nucleoside kinase (ribokinase family)